MNRFVPTPTPILTILAEAVFLLGFLAFVSTFFTAKINIGNTVGAAVCAILFLAILKRQFVAEVIHSLSATLWGKTILIAAAAIIVLCTAAAVLLSVMMIRAAHNPPDSPQTIIVLGCRVKPDRPTVMLQNRINAAFEYLTENPDTVCIASGGQGSDEPMSEAECIRDALVALGIESERIILEDKSTSTYENLLNSSAIMEELGLGQTAVIVTSEFHQLRAKIIAQRLGLCTYSISSKTNISLLPTYWIREWFGVSYELFFGTAS